MKFSGVIPPMVTPFTQTGEVDYEAHSFNLARWSETKLAGYLTMGSNSEAAYLSEAEKLDLIRATKPFVKPDQILLAGTGVESTRETIRLTNLAAKAGADAALILTPNYYQDQMTDEAQKQYFLDVADQADIPILLYNVTKYTQINLPPWVVSELAEHPNILGMKDSSGNVVQLKQLLEAIDSKSFELIAGTASVWYEALDLGIPTGIMALANCLPQELIHVQELFLQGETERAKELAEALKPLNKAVTATHGVAGLKYAVNQLGYHGGVVRRPLLELTQAAKQEIDQLLERWL